VRNDLMASESPRNPYSVGTDGEQAEFEWTDRDVEFTETEIRVRGDFELPQICIHTGARDDLILRERTMTAEPLFVWWMQWSFILTCAFAPILAIAAFMARLIRGPAGLQFWHIASITAAGGAIAMLLGSWSRSVNVKWYLSQSYAAWKQERKRIFGVVFVLASTLGLIIKIVAGSWWWLIPIVVAGIAGAIQSHERTIRASSIRDDKFILKGHSAEFTHAWAEKIAAEADQRRV